MHMTMALDAGMQASKAEEAVMNMLLYVMCL